MKYLVVFLVLALAGCSNTKDIAKQAGQAHGTLALIGDHADAIRQAIANSRTPASGAQGKVQPAPIPPDVGAVLDGIDQHAAAIQDAVKTGHKQVGQIQKDLPGVIDAIPMWEKLIYLVLIVAIIGGVIYLLTMTGALKFISGWLGLAAPSPKSLTTP